MKENQLPGPFYVFRDYAAQYYLGAKAKNFDFTSDVNEVSQDLGKGGTLVVVDFPDLDKQSGLWKEFQRCELRKTVEDESWPLGYVFSC